MTPEQREKASKDLTSTYLNSYYAEWRLAMVLANKKLLDERYEFFKDIAKDVSQWDDKDGEATIAQEIKHGLYFDSISHCIQYIEDLFALIKASKKPDYFIRNIITYKAGEITNSIKVCKTDIESLSRSFHFPKDLPFTDEDNRKGFDAGVNNLQSFVNDLIQFYKDYWFFYSQYKHGLAVGMRPLGNKYNEEQIAEDKKGDFAPYLVVYDNMNIKAAAKRGSLGQKDIIMMRGFTENVRPFIGELEEHNNFLRLVYPPDGKEFSYDLLVDIAFKAKMCLTTFIENYAQKIKAIDKKDLKFMLPTEDFKSNKNYHITYNDN